ncbi:hypothetical protein A3B54_03580 [Candidatus Curtissbacteria bacterium RIFCSPLOWO2_01_FULL_42_50]|uniref:Toxin YoeB n=1 Tax=Candidatus Curtissbacteria bacterium RIFCSPLOWO2_01_FULL_42_50 TaxID=1797730 RepID=A0A1F5H2N7_9BACT|nr:MAG: hypothetical protein A3E71_04470 [Candidatus Curtissbacteria bacterium RIFCSPHIGHO2_12_FULL_42_33]OGD98393.1 MAG: hypothetical protein A3B54_03580 [Candidatus Curtissbacteria bacterium RIFCSPLOWO2_01_FULL_42_50]
MQVKPLNKYLQKYVVKRNLARKFEKQLRILVENLSYPSLNLELLEPKDAGRYSFRIDKKYRAIFIFTKPDEIEIVDINPHYE